MNVKVFQFGANLMGQDLPGNDIAVVFHDGQYNFVSRFDIFPSPCVGDKIDPFSRIAYKYQGL